MAETDHKKGPTHEGHDPLPKHEVGEGATVGPGRGMKKLGALAAKTTKPKVEDVVTIIEENWDEHEALMKAVMQLWGNQFAGQVTSSIPRLAKEGGTSAEDVGAEPVTEEEEVRFDTERDAIEGTHTAIAKKGDFEGSITSGIGTPTTPATFNSAALSYEPGKELGENTRAYLGIGGMYTAGEGMSATGTGGLQHRMGNRFVGSMGTEWEKNLMTGEVHIAGGPSIRMRTGAKSELQLDGLIDNTGAITTGLTYTIFKERVFKLPLESDERHDVLKLFIQGTTGTTVGGEHIPGQIQAGIRYRF